ncbi:hypothetical protein ACXET9_13175 [Brachybacterium sp. DNPG3]
MTLDDGDLLRGPRLRGPRVRTPDPWEVLDGDVLEDAGVEGTRSDGTRIDGGAALDAFIDLSAGIEARLHQRLGDPTATLAEIALCLEVLVAHGRGRAEDVDALRPRWEGEIAVFRDTTDAEWRHPAVTLSLIAAATGHPFAATTSLFWDRRQPRWIPLQATLTWTDGVHPAGLALARLRAEIEGTAHRPGVRRVYLLAAAAADGRRPVDHSAELLERSSDLGARLNAATAAVACAVPEAPLWGYLFDPSSSSWLVRARLVAEDESLPSCVQEASEELVRFSRAVG